MAGTSNVAYFKDIHRLVNGNEIYIYYGGKKYVYKVIKKYEVPKADHTPLFKVEDKTVVTLITCKSTNYDYRVIVVGELVNVE